MRATSRGSSRPWQRLRCLLLWGICAGCVACGGSLPRGDCLDGAEAGATVYLVSHGWHAGLVLRRADIPPDAWAAQAELPAGEYLEIGWGDRDYYRSPDPSWGTTLKAALWPTASVLHLVALDGPVPAYFPRSEIIAIPLSTPGLARLSRYIDASYQRDAAGRTVLLGPGLYGRSRLYLSRETYHLLNTCNVWTARALRTAGCPISPGTTLSVDALLSRARAFGSTVQAPLATPATGDPPAP